MSVITGIAIKNRPRVAMQSIDSATVTVDNGILGDFRGTQIGRQITIMSNSGWKKACAELNAELPWTQRRANLLVDDIHFTATDIGRHIRIGEVELVISEETAPCSLMDKQHQGLRKALMPDWRGGACCSVLKAGEIKLGDEVVFF